MAKISLQVVCRGCGTSNKVTLKRKPTYHTPIVTKFNCTECKSRFLVGIQKSEVAGQVKVDTDPIELSAVARANLKAAALAVLAKKPDVPAIEATTPNEQV